MSKIKKYWLSYNIIEPTIKFNIDTVLFDFVRALALKNANAISKDFLAFHGSKMFASKNCKPYYCKIFCNTVAVF